MFEILAQLCPDDSVQILPCKSFRANPSRLSEVKERLEGPKYNIYLGGGGGKGLGWTGEGDRYGHNPKRGHFMEVSQHFCPSL